MKKCPKCKEEFRHYEWEEVWEQDRYWKLKCPYCGEVLKIKKYQ